MTSRTRQVYTFKDYQDIFDNALNAAVVAGTLVHGTTLDFDMREAINKVAHEYPSATTKSIQKAKAEWDRYARWWAAAKSRPKKVAP